MFHNGGLPQRLKLRNAIIIIISKAAIFLPPLFLSLSLNYCVMNRLPFPPLSPLPLYETPEACRHRCCVRRVASPLGPAARTWRRHQSVTYEKYKEGGWRAQKKKRTRNATQGPNLNTLVGGGGGGIVWTRTREKWKDKNPPAAKEFFFVVIFSSIIYIYIFF